MSILKKIDVYGSVFTFTVFGGSKYKTNIGGVLSLISVGLMLLFTFLFGRDFLYRVNPKIVSQNVVPINYTEPFKLNNKNLILAWRIEDESGMNVDFEGMIYPTITYNSYAKDTAGNWAYFNSTQINITKCNEVGNYNMLSPTYDTSTFYCFDWESSDEMDFFFGGYWDASFINYFTLGLSYCPDGKPFQPDTNCTELNDLNDHFLSSNPWYFSLVYPQFYFSPDDLENPLNVWYANYFFALGLNLQKVDRFFFQSFDLNDDQGWIFTEKNQTNKYATDTKSFDYLTVSNDNLLSPGRNSKFYNINFYMQKNYMYYTRSYMKIQDLAAIIGGFIRLIMIACEIICAFVNHYMRNDLLYNEFFDLRERSDSKHSFSMETIVALTKKMNYEQLRMYHKGQKELKEQQQESSKVELREHSKEILQQNIPNRAEQLRLQPVNHREIVFNRHEKNYVNFGVSYQCKRCFCRKKMKQLEERKKNVIHNYLRAYFDERMDVLFYLKSLFKLDRLTSLLFNKHQSLALDFLKQPNLYEQHDENQLEDLKEEDKAKEVIKYFKGKINGKTLENTDIQMLKLISADIVEHIK